MRLVPRQGRSAVLQQHFMPARHTAGLMARLNGLLGTCSNDSQAQAALQMLPWPSLLRRVHPAAHL